MAAGRCEACGVDDAARADETTTATPAADSTDTAGRTAAGTPIVSARDLVKVYGEGDTAVRALDGVSVDFARGAFTAIMGPSGSGKSTLMHCVAGLDRPTSGSVVVDGEETSRMSERGLTRLRRTRLGFVFQAFNLIPTLTALENITLPLDIARRPVDAEHLDAVVRAVGLADRLDHKPAELSGGQQQRVACARALVARPAVVLADEPTGNLDSVSSREVLAFLRRSVEDLGQSVVMVTHDPTAASFAHRVLFLADGRVVDELHDPTAESILATLGAIGPDATREDRSAAALDTRPDPADAEHAPHQERHAHAHHPRHAAPES
ncbi:ABC transporter ATP-binding protein [Miniimonas sp. S16]|uniref:ABC transporter ATP-binding protein n=1 Tax=Miniimonas sp. S16 TaxID=2171623 RepID=UPI000D528C6A